MAVNFDDNGDPVLSTSTTEGVGTVMPDEDVPPAPPEEGPAESSETTPIESPIEEKKQSGFDRRIQELTQRNALYQSQIESLTQSLQHITQQRATTPVEQRPAGPPKPEDFDSPDEYLQKRVSYEVQEKMGQVWQQQQQALQLQQLQQRWQQQLTQARATYADYDEVVGPTPMSQTMGFAIQNSDQGSELAYYLGQHRTEADRISRLDPLAQVRELGRLEERLTANKQRSNVSKASPPIRPVEGRGPVDREPTQLSMDEYAKQMDAAELKLRKEHRKLL
jgi:hypothetical protein